ncbi:MAG TPA: response regulator transcription factor [Actinomycetes bacterium]|nr:response regulator transcription factor [Actinomycetes bacterium]
MTSTAIEDGPLPIDEERQAVPVKRTRVVVVDDHRTFAELLARALDAESDLECVGHAQDSGEAFAAVERLRPDVVLMDVHLPDRDGICTTAELVRSHPELKVLILTAHASLADIERAATAGASGFLAKDGSLIEVLEGLRTARRGSLILPDGLLARLSAVGESEWTVRQWHLTPRELEVLRLLGEGRDPRGIAKELGVSLNTCRGYVKGILAKLGVHSQLEAVVIASQAGLIRLAAA